MSADKQAEGVERGLAEAPLGPELAAEEQTVGLAEVAVAAGSLAVGTQHDTTKKEPVDPFSNHPKRHHPQFFVAYV